LTIVTAAWGYATRRGGLGPAAPSCLMNSRAVLARRGRMFSARLADKVEWLRELAAK
jgi:hypothetical protein